MQTLTTYRGIFAALSLVTMLAGAPAPAAADAHGMSAEALAGWRTALLGLRGMTPKWGVQPVAAFKATMDAGVPIVMLDVREPAEWAEGIVDGAVLVSLTELPTAQGLAKLPLDKQTAMGVYCKSGHRSALGLSLLHNLGYINTINMAGGFDGWKKAGYPVAMPGQ